MTRYSLLFALLLLAGALPVATQPSEPEDPLVTSALSELESGDMERAIAILESGRAGADAGSEQATALLGALYAEVGRPADSLAALRPLAERPDADAAVLYHAGRSALALGNLTDAATFLGRSVELAPGSPARRELGLLYGRQGDFRQAFLYLGPWARNHPDDTEARLAAAMCATQLERAPDAEELLSDLPQDEPRVKLLWGKVLLLQGDPWGALGTLKPLEDDPQPELDLDRRRLMAEAYLMVGQSSAAVEQLEGHATGDPALSLQLATAYYQNGDLDQAIGALEPVAQRLLASTGPAAAGLEDELAGSIALEYGRLLVVAGRHPEALPALEAAAALTPDNKQVFQNLGQALAGAGRKEDADRALERFKSLTEAEARTNVNQLEEDVADPTGRELRKGFRLLAQGDPGQALEIARQELALAPEDFRPRLLEAGALLNLERPIEALDSAEQAVSMAPENADAHYQRGAVQMALNNLEAAEADLRQAITIAPNHTAAMNDLAVLLMDRGDEAEARSLLEKVLELQPGDPVAGGNLARLDAG